MEIPDNKFNYNSPDYRYGYNGKEKDSELKGEGNSYDYGMRIYDSRVARFMSLDPLFRKFAWNSPYSFAENDVIRSIDLDGEEKYVVNQYRDENGAITKIRIHSAVSNDGKVLDQHLTLNGTDYSGSEVLIINHDAAENKSYNAKTKFNRIQQKVFDNKNNMTPIVRSDNTAVAQDDNGTHIINDAHVERKEDDIRVSGTFEYFGVFDKKNVKFIAGSLNKGGNIGAKNDNKITDEFQIQGPGAKGVKKSLDPLLTPDAKEKENTTGVPNTGDTKVKTRTYDIKN